MALFPGAGGDGNNVPLLFFWSQVESGAISRIFTQVYLVIRIKLTLVTNNGPSGPISTWPRMPKRAKWIAGIFDAEVSMASSTREPVLRR
jgi:hypothetical protein